MSTNKNFKNVLYIVNSSLPTSTGGGRTRIISEAKQARKHSHTVRILCFFPFHHIFTKFSRLVSAKTRLKDESQCDVYYFPKLPLTRWWWVSSLNRFYGGAIACLLCRWHRITIVHCHGITASLIGLAARSANRDLKVVSDFHGAVVAEYMYERNLSEPDLMAARIEKAERLVLRNADKVIFVSEAMRDYYERKYQLSATSYSIIPCATNAAAELLNGRRNEMRQKHGLNDRLVFCYAGSGENYQLPGSMCHLFKKILEQFPKSYFLIFSHHREVFLKSLKEARIDSSHYQIRAVRHEEIFEMLQLGDFGFLLRDGSVVNQVASPTKFAEYCVSGLPVITTQGVGDFSEMTTQYDLGCVVDLQNLSDLSMLTAFITKVQENREAYQQRCSRFAREHLAWDAFGADLAALYTS